MNFPSARRLDGVVYQFQRCTSMNGKDWLQPVEIRAISGATRGAMLRRIAIIRIAQKAGLTLAEIKDALASLPQDRVPSVRDWRRLSSAWRSAIEIQLHNLTILRDQFESCIGCGCLSLTDCPLRNPNDVKITSFFS